MLQKHAYEPVSRQPGMLDPTCRRCTTTITAASTRVSVDNIQRHLGTAQRHTPNAVRRAMYTSWLPVAATKPAPAMVVTTAAAHTKRDCSPTPTTPTNTSPTVKKTAFRQPRSRCAIESGMIAPHARDISVELLTREYLPHRHRGTHPDDYRPRSRNALSRVICPSTMSRDTAHALTSARQEPTRLDSSRDDLS